jgi:hypothetical protein
MAYTEDHNQSTTIALKATAIQLLWGKMIPIKYVIIAASPISSPK